MLTDDCTILRYRAPAVEWTDALPLGNGRLGAMCFGGVGEDRFQLNENTCWSGTPETAYGSRPVTDGPERLAAARAALASGDVRAAEEAVRGLQGGNSQAFQPLADLWITQPAGEPPSVYQRSLDMRSAVVSHTHSGPYGRVSQEAWIGSQALVIRRRLSRPARLRIRLTSPHPTAALDRPSAFPASPDPTAALDRPSVSPAPPDPTAALDRPSVSPASQHPTAALDRPSACPAPPHSTAAVDRPSTVAVDQLVMTVRMPSDVGDEITYGPGSVTAMAGLRVLGAAHVEFDGDELVVDVDDEVILVLAAVTDYIDPLTPPQGEIGERLRERLDDVTTLLRQTGGYATLRAAHEREHLRLFARTGVRLGPPEAVSRLDTTERLKAHAAGESDPALVALQFQYGRYLLISSSRPGGLPAGLQGLWNDSVRPPWNANYTTNINLEMNYWPALVTNLAECHLPLLDWLRHAAVRGRK
ncbi:glycosyl hydrolase family 65 [Paractinoplanes brasiliensis]|uniref:Glycosyl hydrolase family 65 n=1 Tax=Paractinoplanes brasiliensis TaxID=52695 RepID=A0A4R6JDK3_9ACTN|nr:glycoside hydrolase N-terminal domain-containing protein [Actinoplanes brasiliensis]TDO32605.1 glycosyl hydrolase family 65 [Actinoplanes brasiliensis]GID27516.1 hypothetical protein Abr02nite_24990 [Actinoplanes brasiliensis]